MLDLENFEEKFKSILESSEWKLLEEKFINSTNILLIGNGGNLAIADHAAIDISRLTDKNGISPGSGITATSIIGDKDAKNWFKTWVEYRMRGLDPSKTMVISFSCSTTGTSSEASMMALEYASSLGMPCALITAQPKTVENKDIIMIPQNVALYHTSEVLSLALTYQLTHAAGFECPSVFKKARQRNFEKLGIESEVKTGDVK